MYTYISLSLYSSPRVDMIYVYCTYTYTYTYIYTLYACMYVCISSESCQSSALPAFPSHCNNSTTTSPYTRFCTAYMPCLAALITTQYTILQRKRRKWNLFINHEFLSDPLLYALLKITPSSCTEPASENLDLMTVRALARELDVVAMCTPLLYGGNRMGFVRTWRRVRSYQAFFLQVISASHDNLHCRYYDNRYRSYCNSEMLHSLLAFFAVLYFLVRIFQKSKFVIEKV